MTCTVRVRLIAARTYSLHTLVDKLTHYMKKQHDRYDGQYIFRGYHSDHSSIMYNSLHQRCTPTTQKYYQCKMQTIDDMIVKHLKCSLVRHPTSFGATLLPYRMVTRLLTAR